MTRRSDYVSRIVARATGFAPPALGRVLAPQLASAGPVEDPFLHADVAVPVDAPRAAAPPPRPPIAPRAAPADPFEAPRAAPPPRAPIVPEAAPVVTRELHRVTERVVERTARAEEVERLAPIAPRRLPERSDPFADADAPPTRAIVTPAPIVPAPVRTPEPARWLRPRDEQPAWPPARERVTPAPAAAPRVEPPRAAIPVLRPVAPAVAAPRPRRAATRLTIGRVVVEVSRPAPVAPAAPPTRAAAPSPAPRPFGAGGHADLAIGRSSGLGQG